MCDFYDCSGLAIAETEVYADAIFGEDTKIETLIEVIPMGMPLRPLTNGVVFLRDGEDSPQAVSALPPCQV